MARNKKNNSTAIILIIAFAVLTAVAVGAAIYVNGGVNLDFSLDFFKGEEKEQSEESSVLESSSNSETSIEGEGSDAENSDSEEETQTIVNIPMPTELRTGVLRAGREIDLTSPEASRQSIDKYIDYCVSMGFNSVLIDPADFEGGVIYESSQFEGYVFGEEFSPIEYAVSMAHEQNLHTMVKYYITPCNMEEAPKPFDVYDSEVYSNIVSDINNFTKKYKCDTVLAEGYYYPVGTANYSNYIKTGAFSNFEDFEGNMAAQLLHLLKEAVVKNKTAPVFGIVTEPQWAAINEDDKGSETTSPFSCKTDGNADIFEIYNKVPFDFVAVDCYGSTEDQTIPFEKVVSWWSDMLSGREIPFTVIHAAQKAVTDETGWGEYDQIPRQVIAAREKAGFLGSIFDSLVRMEQDPKEFATKLRGYYEGTVKEEHIKTDLNIISPTTRTLTSFDPVVAFSGNTDPNTDATINGVKITTDANGYFSLQLDLKEGENIFKVEHKGKTEIYTITRVIEVVRNVSPTGVLKVDGGTKITITAEAYAQAKVYAVVAGQAIPMAIDTEDMDESLRNTAYAKFKGVYTVPDATTTVQKIGAITVFGEWESLKKSKTGASIEINARALPSDGRPVIVVADMAETFPGDTASAYSDPNYFPIPKGSLDYAVGSEIKYSVNDRGRINTYSFFKLASGLRVLTDDIASVSTANAPVGNKISGVTVTADSRHTKVIVATKQMVSYKAQYLKDRIVFNFHYTDSAPQGSIGLNKNPLFDGLSFSGSSMTLTLANKSIFFGYTAYYDQSGNLVLRFNNPPPVSGNNLSGTKVVIDPGHGGNDTGALGYLGSHPEKVINWAVASYLEAELKERGASVYKLPSQNYNYSLQEREKMASEYDPHVYISVHSNSLNLNTVTTGTEAYYFSPFSYALSQYASRNVANALGTGNRGGKFGYFYVTRNMQYPSILVETGFMTNPAEYNKLINSSYQKKIASAIADSIGSYFKLMAADVRGATGTQLMGSMTLPPNSNNDNYVDSSEDEGYVEDSSQDTDVEESENSSSEKIVLSQVKLTMEIDESVSIWVDNDLLGRELVWEIDDDDKLQMFIDDDSPEIVSLMALEEGTANVTVYFKGDKSSAQKCKIKIE